MTYKRYDRTVERIRRARDIRDRRERAGLSQEGLARLADVSVATVSRWERGVVEPGRLALRGIQGILEDYRKERGK